MKNQILKNLSLCMLFLSVFSSNKLLSEPTTEDSKGENSLKVDVSFDPIKRKASLSPKATWCSSTPSSFPFETIKLDIALSDPLSWDNMGNLKDGKIKNTVISIVKKCMVSTSPIDVLEDKELTIDLGAVKHSLSKDELTAFLKFSLDNLPGNTKAGIGFQASMLKVNNNWYHFEFPLAINKKELFSEEDSIAFNTVVATSAKYYGGYVTNTTLKKVLNYLGGFSTTYKTGDKEGVLQKVTFTCVPLSKIKPDDKNKTSASLSFIFNGSWIRENLGLEGLASYLPEKTQSVIGTLDSIGLLLKNNFNKRDKFNDMQIMFTATTKDIGNWPGAKGKLEFALNPKRLDSNKSIATVNLSISKEIQIM